MTHLKVPFNKNYLFSLTQHKL